MEFYNTKLANFNRKLFKYKTAPQSNHLSKYGSSVQNADLFQMQLKNRC
jgi:hypothetical protein